MTTIAKTSLFVGTKYEVTIETSRGNVGGRHVPSDGDTVIEVKYTNEPMARRAMRNVTDEAALKEHDDMVAHAKAYVAAERIRDVAPLLLEALVRLREWAAGHAPGPDLDDLRFADGVIKSARGES